MSGMYNMVMGRNPVLPFLMAIAGIHQENYMKFGRLRDAWISEDGKTIGILHRNYGELGEAANEAVKSLPNFREQRATEDETYQEWLFNVPEEASGLANELARVSDTTPCFQRYTEAIEALKRGDDTPQTRHMKEVGKEIAAGLTKAFAGDGAQAVKNEDGAVDIVPMEGS